MLEWVDQQCPNFFERYPNLSLVNTLQTTTQASKTYEKKIASVIFGSSLSR